ncbi:G-type lectin S-receptor-like serine/threonine-protein kinase SD2-2 [Gastrolobium bilobum]|uniref:G-type lectin S-receptor-like serine/threonine-protein kinase SD2-2 n=1 Tax=Gastrolobium bilobum TaxID=150636 RepID=UPI002AB0856E|nr:G-type lectin S-receptor-like serine/threonine-protein kinase SD2-2 [Gastrolobium bilobum]
MSLISFLLTVIVTICAASSTSSFTLSSNDNNTTIVIRGDTTILSENRTFELGFFNLSSNQPHWYLAIRYASLPTPNFVWVANRHKPITNLAGSTLKLTRTGQLLLTDPSSSSILWQTNNTNDSKGVDFGVGVELKLLENGNLVLLTGNGDVSWQSFDYPTDTWLPGMNLTRVRSLVSWRTETDPSPGLYSLRLKPPDYGEFELVFNGTVSYWSTGNWTNGSFLNVPEMTIPYIYRFDFEDPFSPTASFGFSERPLESGLKPPTLFRVEHYGQVRQYTWAMQVGSWNMFWSKPDGVCQVRGLCGSFGVCSGEISRLCECVRGFEPVDGDGWGSGDYSLGCHREDDGTCDESDGFEDLGVVGFEGGNFSSFRAKSRSFCERKCLDSCACVGLDFDEGSGFCKNFYGSPLDFQNLTAFGGSGGGGGGGGVLFVRVPRVGSVKKGFSSKALSAAVIGSVAVLGVVVMVTWLVLLKRRLKKKGMEGDGFVPVLNLQLFSYKELQLATRGFSEKVGHGGFGTVFQGELSDSTLVAVKRLERPGGGEKEFRAEVSTIGNIQHVNLVRLRGFCSENSHRLLVYEFMQNGALSAYLRKEGPTLSWDVRFQVAIGTAKGIAYLHEECRCCIIHCDIKPENILLDNDFTAKVSDFGLAKLIGRDFSRVLATMRGTWGYVAPEWISGVTITTKADVYSYGMTLLELLSGRRNVEAPPSDGGRESGCETGEKWFFPPWAAQQIIEGNVTAVIDKKLVNVYNIEEVRRAALVAVWCIQDDEAMRPTMGMVVKMLEGLVEVTIPPPPKLLQALVTGESFHGVKVDSGNGVSTGCSLSGGNLEVSTADSESCIGDVFSPLDVNVNVNVR